MQTQVDTDSSLLQKLNLSPEDKLLLACARIRLSEGQRDELETLVQNPLRWEKILYKSRWHLYALVFQHLSSLENRDHIPPEVMDWFKSAYVTSVGRSLYFRAELGRVLNSLRELQVPVIVLKGAALVNTVYPDSGLRPMTDVDLLVRHEDLDAADSLVRGMGYISPVDSQVEAEMRARDRQLPRLGIPGRPLIFDIHSHVVEIDNPIRFSIDGFWQRARPAPFNGAPCLMLRPEDLLTHLALNFFKDLRFHNYSSLAELCDIAETARYYCQEINWDLLVREVTRNRLTGPVFCGFYLAQQLCDAPFPDSVLLGLQPAGFSTTYAQMLVRQRVLGEKWVAKALVNPDSPYCWRTLASGVFRRVFPSRRSLAERYQVPAQSRGIYYLYLRSLKEALAMTVRFTTRPKLLREDIAVDRWLHSLYRDQRNGAAE